MNQKDNYSLNPRQQLSQEKPLQQPSPGVWLGGGAQQAQGPEGSDNLEVTPMKCQVQLQQQKQIWGLLIVWLSGKQQLQGLPKLLPMHCPWSKPALTLLVRDQGTGDHIPCEIQGERVTLMKITGNWSTL